MIAEAVVSTFLIKGKITSLLKLPINIWAFIDYIKLTQQIINHPINNCSFFDFKAFYQ